MKQNNDVVDLKVLDYIKEYNLLDNFEGIKVTENHKLINIYSDNKRQHFIFQKYRNYLFYFNGFNHSISIPLKEKLDNEFAYVDEDQKEYNDSRIIIEFLKKDIYANKNLIPFLSMLLDINANELKSKEFTNEINSKVIK